MDLEQVRAAKNAKPFVPFRIHFADGTSVDVTNDWRMGFSRSYKLGYVSLDDESFKRFRIEDVVNIEPLAVAC